MSPSELHRHFQLALTAPFATAEEENGLRSLVEAGGVENFLTGLLFIRLHAAGYIVSREYPIGNRCAADLTIHGPTDIHVELKQLNLKDGMLYAPQNLTNDLRRHKITPSIGIIYISDERSSNTNLRFQRFGGANRRAKFDVPTVVKSLSEYFGVVYPESAEKGLLRAFADHGGLKLFAFIVTEPLLPATK